jgi:hypothetical protein
LLARAFREYASPSNRAFSSVSVTVLHFVIVIGFRPRVGLRHVTSTAGS